MACQIGRSMVKNELFVLNQSEIPFIEVCKSLNFETPEELFTAVGRTELSISEFSNQVLTDLWEKEALNGQTSKEYRNEFLSSQAVFSPDGEMFIIEHSGERGLELCKICNPRPGDPIVGSILRKNLDDSCGWMPGAHPGHDAGWQCATAQMGG